jgi:hypothetical protein
MAPSIRNSGARFAQTHFARRKSTWLLEEASLLHPNSAQGRIAIHSQRDQEILGQSREVFRAFASARAQISGAVQKNLRQLIRGQSNVTAR